MGLNVTHGCWDGAYSSFGRFREALAEQVGLKLPDMVGFGGKMPWDLLRPDPLWVLLNHSDCDGEIAHADCGPLAKRLHEIAATTDRATPGAYGDLKTEIEQFADGLDDADANGETVEFH